jgi:hypothetical protein
MTDVLMIKYMRMPASSHPKPKPKEMVFGTKLISVQHLRSEDHTTERDGSKTVWAGNMARSDRTGWKQNGMEAKRYVLTALLGGQHGSLARTHASKCRKRGKRQSDLHALLHPRLK